MLVKSDRKGLALDNSEKPFSKYEVLLRIGISEKVCHLGEGGQGEIPSTKKRSPGRKVCKLGGGGGWVVWGVLLCSGAR